MDVYVSWRSSLDWKYIGEQLDWFYVISDILLLSRDPIIVIMRRETHSWWLSDLILMEGIWRLEAPPLEQLLPDYAWQVLIKVPFRRRKVDITDMIGLDYFFLIWAWTLLFLILVLPIFSRQGRELFYFYCFVFVGSCCMCCLINFTSYFILLFYFTSVIYMILFIFGSIILLIYIFFFLIYFFW